MVRRIARTDNNQAEIVAALRQLGAGVLDLHSVGSGCPDILIGWHGENILAEIKSESGKLTEDEHKFFQEWSGQKTIIRSVADAVMLLEDNGHEYY